MKNNSTISSRHPITRVITLILLSTCITPVLAAGSAQGVSTATVESNGGIVVGGILVLLVALGALFYKTSGTMQFRAKLALLVASILFVTISISLVSIYDMAAIGNELEEVADYDIPLSAKVASVTAHQLEQAIWLERAASAANAVTLSTSRYRESREEFERLAAQVESELDDAEKLAASGLEQAASLTAQNEYRQVISSLGSIHKEHQTFDRHAIQMFELIESGDTENARTMLTSIEIEEDKLDHELIALEEELFAFTSTAALAAKQRELAALRDIIILAVSGTLFAAGLAFFVLKSLMSQLGTDPSRLKVVASDLANGNLANAYSEATEGVYFAIAETVRKMKEILEKIQSASNVVTQASDEVAQGNTNLSQRTQEQASNLEEIAASMEEMTATVNQNAQNAQQASDLANQAREQADRGGEVVTRSIESMDEINKSSRKISDIIGVIDEIAFQTNLLALNAAVEAARAGEQGRGFAVVASEVRNLAGRSATAAKEIKDLIEDSVSKVEEGTRLVNDSGEALTEIVTSIREVSNIVAEIAAASQEQSSGIGQVNTAVTQMDEMTQENAALVEESAAAAEALGAESKSLRDAVAFFNLGNSSDSEPGISSSPTILSSSQPGQGSSKKPALAYANTSNGSDGDWREF